MFCFFVVIFAVRTSGVTDHMANNDAHAVEIARNIVANLNWKKMPDRVTIYQLPFTCAHVFTCARLSVCPACDRLPSMSHFTPLTTSDQ
jgi:hypothetical protein